MRLIILAFVLFWASATFAGELVQVRPFDPDEEPRYAVDTAMTCSHKFSGVIAKGDLAAFEALQVPEGNFGLICLDSPGGSFIEGIKIGKLLSDRRIGTKVDAAARCESACSMIFMGGAAEFHEAGARRWRVLNPLGKLGFHAPALVIEGGVYDGETVTKAYNLSTASVADAISQLILRDGFEDGNAMRVSLLGQMLRTPSSDMFYITTVDHAGRWQIDVGPVDYKAPFNDDTLRRGCFNASEWLNDRSAEIETWDTLVEKSTGSEKQTIYEVILHDIDGAGCKYSLYEAPGPISVLYTDVTSKGGIDLHGYDFLPPSTKLADLASSSAAPATPVAAPPPTNNPSANASAMPGATGECTVGDAPNYSDREPCIRSTTIEGTGSAMRVITMYHWPSGARTVIVRDVNGAITINGGATQLTANPAAQYGECAMNPSSGNLFCYAQASN